MNENNNNNNDMPMMTKPNVFKNFIVALLLITALVGIVFLINGTGKKNLDWITFTSDMTQNKIESIEFSDTKIKFVYKDKTTAYMGKDLTDKVIEYTEAHNSTVISTYQVNMVSKPTSSYNLDSIIMLVLLVGGFVLVITLMTRQLGKSASQSFDFVKNRAKIAKSKVRFSDVAGADEEKEEVKEIVEFLKDPRRFTEMGARIPKGVLLVGVPGTGKTLLAKAIAGEAGVPFFTISGSDFMELFVGVGASRVRDLFNQAKQNAPCIVFIDEIDAIGRQRGTGLGGGNDEREQTLNQLLVQMDGFETNEGIIVIAATNRADILDPALLRPGRFDRQITIHVPDVKGREEILKVHMGTKKFDKSVDFKQIARVTAGFTGAELENLLNEAAILAAREHKPAITQELITEAIDKTTMGPQKKSRVVTDRDKKITAVHESGHAIIGKLVKNNDPIHEISIIPRGNAAGYTVSRPESDDNHVTKSKLLDTITMMLGGRMAEQIVLGDVSTGASNDLERATAIARQMVMSYGMGEKTGLMHFGSDGSYFFGRDYASKNSYSEEFAKVIDEEILNILSACEKQAEKILTANKKKLGVMVDVLLEKSTIYSDEVDLIMEGKTKKTVIEYIDSKLASSDQSKKATEKATTKNVKSSIVKLDETSAKPTAKKEAEIAEKKLETDEQDLTREKTLEEAEKASAKIEVLPSSEISENIEQALETKQKKSKK